MIVVLPLALEVFLGGISDDTKGIQNETLKQAETIAINHICTKEQKLTLLSNTKIENRRGDPLFLE